MAQDLRPAPRGARVRTCSPALHRAIETRRRRQTDDSTIRNDRNRAPASHLWFDPSPGWPTGKHYPEPYDLLRAINPLKFAHPVRPVRRVGTELSVWWSDRAPIQFSGFSFLWLVSSDSRPQISGASHHGRRYPRPSRRFFVRKREPLLTPGPLLHRSSFVRWPCG